MAEQSPQKRARTEDAEETTKNEPEYVYIANRTEVANRTGDAWSCELFLGVFRTLESATRKMKENQVDMIIEEFTGGDLEELAEKYEKSRSEPTKCEYDREALMKDLDSLVEELFQCESANVQYDWRLVKREVQD